MYVRTVSFMSEPFTSLEEAGPAFRDIIGILNPLAHSLLGRKPLAAEALDLDLEEHQEVRKFKDETGLLSYVEYLDEVLTNAKEKSDDQPVAKVRVVLDGNGAVKKFYYETANGRARILLARSKKNWRVSGACRFMDPGIVMRALSSHNVRCVAREVMSSAA